MPAIDLRLSHRKGGEAAAWTDHLTRDVGRGRLRDDRLDALDPPFWTRQAARERTCERARDRSFCAAKHAACPTDNRALMLDMCVIPLILVCLLAAPRVTASCAE
jgi:hypothetical protein